MRTQLVAPVLSLVREAGGDVARLRQRFHLPESVETDGSVTLSLGALHALVDAAAAELGDEFLGLTLARRHRRGTYGLLEYCCRHASTVRDAVGCVGRYAALLNDVVVLSAQERGAVGVIEQRIPGAPLCLGRHGNECFVAVLVRLARELTGVPVVPERVWLAHPAPRDFEPLAAFLGTSRIEFGAEADGVALPREVLDLPVVTSDPVLFALLDRYAAQQLAQRAEPRRFVGRIRQHIRDAIRNGAPSLESTAAALRMHPRTLQRYLAREGVSFHQLVESVRESLARAYVRESDVPLGEVPFLLGYSEPTAFVRAFKRWTGETPGRYRAAGAGAAAARAVPPAQPSRVPSPSGSI